MSADSTTVPIVLIEQIGISAVVGGLISHFLDRRRTRKERESAAFQEKLNLYTIFLYEVNNLIKIGPNVFDPNTRPSFKKQLEAIFTSLESSINTKHHLLKYDEIIQYAEVRALFDNPTTNGLASKRN